MNPLRPSASVDGGSISLGPVRLGPVIGEFSRLRNNQILTDVIFEVQGRRIPAHKVIVAAGSEYLERLLAGQFKEAREPIINIRDVSADLFEQFIRGLYGEPIDLSDWRRVLEIYRLARFYLVRKDVSELLNLISVPPDDFLEFASEVLQITGEELTQKTIDSIASQLKSEVDLSGFSDDFIEVLLGSQSYRPPDSRQTYNMIDRLVKSGRDKRLYQIIDLNRLTPQQVSRLPRNFVRRRQTGEHLPGERHLTVDVPQVIFTGQPFAGEVLIPYDDYDRPLTQEQTRGTVATPGLPQAYGTPYLPTSQQNYWRGAILRVPQIPVDPENIRAGTFDDEPTDNVRAIFPTLGGIRVSDIYLIEEYEIATEIGDDGPYPYVIVKRWRNITPRLQVLQFPYLPGPPMTSHLPQVPGFQLPDLSQYLAGLSAVPQPAPAAPPGGFFPGLPGLPGLPPAGSLPGVGFSSNTFLR